MSPPARTREPCREPRFSPSPEARSGSKEAAPTVCVIVLNWNQKGRTLACLRSLRDQTYPAVRLVMADNGSSDGSVAALRQAWPDLHIVENHANLGYAGGNNAAIEHCVQQFDDAYLLILNNDTIADPAFVAQLVAAARSDPEAGVFGPKILQEDAPEIIASAGGRWDPGRGTCLHRGEGEVDHGQFDQVRDTEILTGCALLMHRSVLERAGAFDERFFLYYEDVDLSYRIRRLGMRCVLVPTAKLWHSVSASTGGPSPLSTYFLSRNRLLFAQRHLRLGAFIRLLANALLDVAIPALGRRACLDAPPWRRLYWLLRSEGLGSLADYRDPTYRAAAYGVRDYLARRFGDCPARVRQRLRLGEPLR